MGKPRRAISLLFLAALFVFGIFCGIKLSGRFAAGPARIYNTAAILQQVQTLSDLVTVKYVIEKAEPWDDPPQSVLGQMFAGESHILLLAHGIVKAGVDLSRIKPDDLRVDGKCVIIRLPPAEVTDSYLDDTQTRVIERQTGFLRSFDKDLEQNIRRTAVDDIRLAALRGGIRQDADERARTQIKALFHQMGFEKVEFKSP